MKPIALRSPVALLTLTLFAAGGSAATSNADCDTGGLRPLLAAGNVLLVGEIHGAVEGPALFAAAVCTAARKGLPVTVALEIPLEEEQAITRFLGSAGSAADRAALLAGPFWTREYQDGRSSMAMLQLLDGLRGLRRERRKIQLVLLDSEPGPFRGGQERDDFMSRRLIEAVESAGATGVVLAYAGNVHTRTTPGVPWNPDYRPAGVAVEGRWPERTVSLLLTSPAGTTWMCSTAQAASCGPARLGGGDVDAGSVALFPAARDGHEGEVRLGGATASPPAALAAKPATAAPAGHS